MMGFCHLGYRWILPHTTWSNSMVLLWFSSHSELWWFFLWLGFSSISSFPPMAGRIGAHFGSDVGRFALKVGQFRPVFAERPVELVKICLADDERCLSLFYASQLERPVTTEKGSRRTVHRWMSLFGGFQFHCCCSNNVDAIPLSLHLSTVLRVLTHHHSMVIYVYYEGNT